MANPTVSWHIHQMLHRDDNGCVTWVEYDIQVTDGVTKDPTVELPEEEREVYVLHHYGDMELDPPGSGMTPYESLTEAEVLGWVKNALGTSTCKDFEDMALSTFKQICHVEQSEGLPWQPPALEEGDEPEEADDSAGAQ